MTNIIYNRITTLFLDVGNTLISIDFDWVCKELKKNGIQCNADILRRAEAAARPAISSTKINEIKNIPGMDMRLFYFTNILEKLSYKGLKDAKSIKNVAMNLVQSLFPKGNAMRLWSYVLPGTREALTKFKDMGFQMHVISNADGTVEKQLERSDLRSFFGEVIDSHVVQIEKPAPEIFQLALDAAGCTPQESLYVGDIYDVDIVGSESVGMQAVLLDPFSDWDDIECERVPDLLSLANKFLNIKKQSYDEKDIREL